MEELHGRVQLRSLILRLGLALPAMVAIGVVAQPRRSPPLPRVDLHPTLNALARLASLGLPVYCAGSQSREFAFTFDDGPGPYTSLALRILTRRHVPATFFDVGKVIVLRPSLLPRELRVGAIGEHSWTHRFLPSLPPAEIEPELTRTNNLIEGITHQPVRLFRPPFGALSPTVQADARRLGMVTVLWSVDSRDWAGAKWNAISTTVLHKIRPGSIVLMHENHGQTLHALSYVILPHLSQTGLRPVSLPKLLTDNPPSVPLLRGGPAACGKDPRVTLSRDRRTRSA